MPYSGSVFCLKQKYFSKIIVLGRVSSGFVSDLTETLDKLLVFGKQKRDTVFFKFSNDKA